MKWNSGTIKGLRNQGRPNAHNTYLPLLWTGETVSELQGRRNPRETGVGVHGGEWRWWQSCNFPGPWDLGNGSRPPPGLTGHICSGSCAPLSSGSKNGRQNEISTHTQRTFCERHRTLFYLILRLLSRGFIGHSPKLSHNELALGVKADPAIYYTKLNHMKLTFSSNMTEYWQFHLAWPNRYVVAIVLNLFPHC